jgi:hypothetical protein
MAATLPPPPPVPSGSSLLSHPSGTLPALPASSPPSGRSLPLPPPRQPVLSPATQQLASRAVSGSAPPPPYVLLLLSNLWMSRSR